MTALHHYLGRPAVDPATPEQQAAHGAASTGVAGWRGEATEAATRDSAASSSQRPPSASAAVTAAWAAIPVRGSATASARKTRPVGVPGDEPARRRGVVAEPDPVRVAPVARDRHPHLGTATGLDPPLLEGAGAGALDDDVGRGQQPPEPGQPVGRGQVEGDVLLAVVQDLEEAARVTPGAVGPGRRLDLDDPGAVHQQQAAAEGPGPEALRSTTSGGRSSGGPSPIRWWTTRSATAGGRSGTADRAKPKGTPAATTSSTDRVATASATADHASSGSAASPSQAGTEATSSGRPRFTASQPSAAVSSRVPPPQLVVPWRDQPASAARSARRASGSSTGAVEVQVDDPVDGLRRGHQRRAAGTAGERGQPARHPGVHGATVPTSGDLAEALVA